MSYQVNFRVFIPDCAYYEAEIVAKIAQELQEAATKIVEANGVKGKQVGVTSGEVTYLTK